MCKKNGRVHLRYEEKKFWIKLIIPQILLNLGLYIDTPTDLVW
jgi:hypothetical protein